MVQKRKDHMSNNEPEPKKARQDHSTAKEAPITARTKFLQQLGRQPAAEIASKLERCPKCLWASKSHDDKRCGPHFFEARLKLARKLLLDGKEIPEKLYLRQK
jgi:hypothetical protein